MGHSVHSNNLGGHNSRLPPFTGKELWKVWSTRFCDVASRQGWTLEECLGQILPNVMKLNQILAAIPKIWKKAVMNMTHIDKKLILENININIKDITTKHIYNSLIIAKYEQPIVIKYWNKILPNTIYIYIEDEHWNEIFNMPKNTISEVRVQSLQFKILHNLINCRKKN